MGKADLDALLDAAVGAVGGAARPGQQQMAKAVAESLERGDPLLVEAGTGTGKSLAYLVPLILEALTSKATLGEVCETLRGVFGSYRPGRAT